MEGGRRGECWWLVEMWIIDGWIPTRRVGWKWNGVKSDHITYSLHTCIPTNHPKCAQPIDKVLRSHEQAKFVTVSMCRSISFLHHHGSHSVLHNVKSVKL